MTTATTPNLTSIDRAYVLRAMTDAAADLQSVSKSMRDDTALGLARDLWAAAALLERLWCDECADGVMHRHTA